jgi:hypothetical protein
MTARTVHFAVNRPQSAPVRRQKLLEDFTSTIRRKRNLSIRETHRRHRDYRHLKRHDRDDYWRWCHHHR